MVLNKVIEGQGNFGYNAQTAEYGDLMEMGVVDPTKVARCALQNAASVAGLILTTDAMVAESPNGDSIPTAAVAWAAWVVWAAWGCDERASANPVAPGPDSGSKQKAPLLRGFFCAQPRYLDRGAMPAQVWNCRRSYVR